MLVFAPRQKGQGHFWTSPRLKVVKLPVARSGVARRYAEAVFEIARAHNSFDLWAKELGAIVAVQQHPELAGFLASPAVGMSAKDALLSQHLVGMSKEGMNLVRLLLRKGRFALAPQIADHYRRLVNEYRGIKAAEVTSATPLSPAELKAIARRLSAMTDRKVTVETRVDPSIIGGIVVRIGDQLIDASVKGRLEALKRRLAPA